MNDTSSTVNHNAYIASAPQIDYALIAHHPSELSLPETGLVVPVFQKGVDPIDAINHMMSFLTSVITSRYPTTNNQLRTSSNPRQQATINDGRLKPNLYDGRIIEKSDAVVILDTEETLMLAEESRSKMIEKQKDPQLTEKKVITKPINYAILNQLSTDFKTRFVPQIELSAEQAFWSQYSVQTDEPNLSATTTIVEVPKELHKISMVNSCLKKLKYHLASFDMVVKERTTATAITEGTWAFEHTKACFRDDIIPFVKALKELFTSFDQYLIDEVTEVQNVFKQTKLAVEQHHEEKHKFQNKMKHVLQENDRLLTQALSVEIVNVVVYDNVTSECLNVDVCAHCVTIESELEKDFIKKECYETLLQQYHTLEKLYIIGKFFKINELKAQAQVKDTVILQLKEKLHSLKGDVTERSVKREVEEIETLNIELDHKIWSKCDKDESETNDPQSVPSFVQSSEHVKAPKHSVQPVEAHILDATLKPTSSKSNSSSKKRNRKTCFVCRSVDHLIKDCDYHDKKKAQPTPKNYAHGGNNKQNASFTHKHPSMHMVPAAVLTQSKAVSIIAVRPVCADVPKIMVTRPRHAHSIDTKSKSPIRRHITHSPSPKTSNSPPRVIAAQALVVSVAKGKKRKWGNPQYALKDKGVIDSGCSR
nr:hypothetical protein [Tanacetum cinerariifolium]